MTAMSSSMLDAAVGYAQRGWLVFPLKPRTKKPATRHGFKDATTDPEKLASWFTRAANRMPNIGIATGEASGIVVVDIDDDDALAEWRACEAQHGATLTLTAQTGGGGLHLIFQHPGIQISNRTPFQRIHIRGDGGYIVAPPSVHPSGNVYQWLNDEPIAELPIWLLELLVSDRKRKSNASPLASAEPTPSLASSSNGQIGSAGRYAEAALSSAADRIRHAVEGHRNDTLNREAFAIGAFVRDGQLDRAMVERELSAAGRAAGLDEREVDKTLRSALDSAIARSRRVVASSAGAGINTNSDASTNGKAHKAHAESQADSDIDSSADRLPTHDELARQWIDAHPDTKFGMGEFYRYASGVWHLLPAGEAESEMLTVICNAKARKIKPTASILASVRKLASVMIIIPDDCWDANFDVIVCANGTLHIPTMTLREHSALDYQTSGLPFNYDPGADCPTFKYVLQDRIPFATDLVQEFAGYALTTDTRYEIALWFHGPRGSGKSTIVEAFQVMLGKRAGLLGLSDIEKNRFALSDLPGKTLVVSTEQPSSYLSSSHILNKIISGEPIMVERKYRDAFTIVPRAKILWAMNDLPRVNGATDGILRRVQVIEFPPSITAPDPDIKEVIKTEGPGILNWALEGLRRLRTRGRFIIPDRVKAANERYERTNDIPATFIEEQCDRGDNYEVGANALYQAYRSWCEATGHKPQSSTSIADEWRRLGLEKRIVNGRKFWCGLRLKPMLMED